MRCSVRRLLVLSVLPLLFLAACGGGGGSEAVPGVTVQGNTESKPKVQVEDGLSVDNMQVKTLVKGDGEKVGGTDTVTVDYVGINGRNGQEFDSSWKTGQPATFSLGPGMISGFNKALTGQTVGSRVVAAMPPEDAYPDGNPQAGIKSTDSLVFVIDIRGAFASQAEGSPVTPPADLPHLLTDPQGLPGQFHAVKTTAPAPGQVVVQPVIEGTGDPVQAGQSVTMKFLGQIYPAGQTLVNPTRSRRRACRSARGSRSRASTSSSARRSAPGSSSSARRTARSAPRATPRRASRAPTR